MKISFDFDGCLKENKLVRFICSIMLKDNDVFILTSREEELNNNHNSDLLQVVNELGINKDNVIFTNGKLKGSYVLEHKIDIHFDNSYDEILDINSNFHNDNKPGILTNFEMDEVDCILYQFRSKSKSKKYIH